MKRHAAWLAVAVVLSVTAGAAWAYWSAGSVPGSGGAAAAASVDQGARPTVSATGRSVTVTWAATTLSNGQAVDGYLIKRYDAGSLAGQSVLSGCAGTITVTSCTENVVPAGQWVYTVTPIFATNWRGVESAKSTAVTVAAPTLSLAPTTVKPGGSLTGSAAGFLPGETLRYRLDSSTGVELTGSLAGSPTPASVPAAGGGVAQVTVPAGTTDGTHTVYAVTTPSGDAATFAVVVDSTPPPAPVLTSTPASVSGDSVTFAFTEAETSAAVECSLDGAAFAPCGSPVDYTGLAASSHTFQVRATDTVGNVSAVTSYTWTVNLSVPNVSIAFPVLSGIYNDSSFNAACGTASAGDVCGSADDDLAVLLVHVSLRRLSTGLWWNGTSFSAATETFLLATGTTDWIFAVDPSSLPEGDYTLRARASDGVNLGYDSRTFTIDRTAPAAPTISSGPPATSAASATFAFTTSDPTAGFECRLDTGSFAACASVKSYSALTDGSHTFSVHAIDGAGNTSAVTASTWTVDATAPTATMTFPTPSSLNLSGWAAGCGTPAGDLCGTATDVGSGLASVSVSIRRSSTGSYWDGAAFVSSTETWFTATGTTSWSYLFAGSNLPADGTYSIRYRATDAVGNATTGAVDVILDTAPPPAPQIVQAPSNPSGDSARFDFTDAEGGASTQCQLDAGAWAACAAPVTYTGLAAGSHTFRVRATDAAGNLSPVTSYNWSVDIGLPSISITSPGSAHAYNDATYAAGCGTPVGDVCGIASDPQSDLANVALSIKRTSTSLYWNGTSFASTTEVFLPVTGTTTWSYAIPAAAFPAEGTYQLRARATDGAGNSAADTVTLTVDRTAPTAPTITSGPTGTTSGGDTFSFTGEPSATFECRIDAGAWAACTSPKTYSALADGSHTFDVRATDAAGNTGATTSRTWTVDANPPTIGTTFPAVGGRYTNTGYNAGCGTASTGDVCGTASDTPSGVAKVEISVQRTSTGLYLTGTTFSSASQNWVTATGTTSWSYALPATNFPTDDTYVLSVRATDNVGNARTTTTTFVIDRTKPTGAGFTTTNAATSRKLDLADTFSLTYSEAVAPATIIAGWNGTTTQNVVVRATNASKDRLTIYNATNTTLLPLGTINLKRSDYVAASMTFGLTGTPSTITMSGSRLTITLGTPSGIPTVAAAAANVTWTPAIGVTDLAGNAAATTSYTETDLDNDF